MRGASWRRLLLELMCAQVLLPAAPAHDESAEGSTKSELAARVERLERQVANAAVTNRQEVPAPAEGPGTGSGGRPGTGEAAARTGSGRGSNGGQSAAGTRADQHPAERGQATGSEASATLDLDVLQSRWADVLEAVRDVRKTAWILLSNYASIDVVEGNVLTMAFDTEGNAKGFVNSGSDGYLADVLHAMFGVRLVIRAIVNPAGGRGAARGPARPAGGDHGGAGGPPRSRAPTRRAAQPRDSRGRASAVSPRSQPAGSDLPDDPRPHTDAAAGDETDDPTGTDLVMRELGGRVIDEITDI